MKLKIIIDNIKAKTDHMDVELTRFEQKYFSIEKLKVYNMTFGIRYGVYNNITALQIALNNQIIDDL